MRALATVVAALGAAAVGCQSPPTDPLACTGVIEMGCDRDGGLAGGYIDDASGAWVSSTWEGPYFPYPKYTTIRLCHGLGRVPNSIELYAAFASTGPTAQQIGSVATFVPVCSANSDGGADSDGGTTAEINARSVLIRNAGGQDFYARVVLRP